MEDAIQPYYSRKMDNWSIINSVEINNGKVFANGRLVHDTENDFTLASKELYKKYSKAYIKFFKMDALSKLGFLTAEILLKDFNLENIDMNEIALVVGNSNATKDTDLKYLQTMREQPSPAVFVYTLPNILVGEICIRHGFKGQNVFYISGKFDEEELYENIELLINNSTTDYVIGGWVDFINPNDYKSILYLIGKDSKSSKFAINNLKRLNNIK